MSVNNIPTSKLPITSDTSTVSPPKYAAPKRPIPVNNSDVDGPSTSAPRHQSSGSSMDYILELGVSSNWDKLDPPFTQDLYEPSSGYQKPRPNKRNCLTEHRFWYQLKRDPSIAMMAPNYLNPSSPKTNMTLLLILMTPTQTPRTRYTATVKLAFLWWIICEFSSNPDQYSTDRSRLHTYSTGQATFSVSTGRNRETGNKVPLWKYTRYSLQQGSSQTKGHWPRRWQA